MIMIKYFNVTANLIVWILQIQYRSLLYRTQPFLVGLAGLNSLPRYSRSFLEHCSLDSAIEPARSTSTSPSTTTLKIIRIWLVKHVCCTRDAHLRRNPCLTLQNNNVKLPHMIKTWANKNKSLIDLIHDGRHVEFAVITANFSGGKQLKVESL